MYVVPSTMTWHCIVYSTYCTTTCCQCLSAVVLRARSWYPSLSLGLKHPARTLVVLDVDGEKITVFIVRTTPPAPHTHDEPRTHDSPICFHTRIIFYFCTPLFQVFFSVKGSFGLIFGSVGPGRSFHCCFSKLPSKFTRVCLYSWRSIKGSVAFVG